ncbi:50S ribosomal protein L5 [Candidatus Micrarchaeota archaeon RBG_16_49_10]|nr:MAG: 50S ribosomal protein L5 [Candidatus Micrarchaeota archaeon RBG_16_49_10]
MNPMKEVLLDKVVVNMGCADDKQKLDKSVKFLGGIIDQKVKVVQTRKRNTFGMPKGKDTGVKVTLRGAAAKKFVKDALVAVENKLRQSQINGGNLSFGVKETIDLPGVKYDPDIGILGFDVCIALKRRGFRVKERSLKKSKIGKKHLISKEETIEWVKKNYGVEVLG